MESTYKGVIKELGNSTLTDGSSIKEYKYIELNNGEVLTKVRIGTSLDGKLHAALNNGGIVQIELFADIIIGLVLDSDKAYINRSVLRSSSGTYKFLGWLGIILGIITIPVFLLGVLIIGHSIKTLDIAKTLAFQEQLASAQQALNSRYPKAIIFNDY